MEAFTSRLTIGARKVTRTASRAGIADAVAYWLVLAGIYILQGAVWYYPFKAKLFDDDGIAPPPIQEQFSGTIIDSVPGINAAWVILGIVQGLICVVLLVSLVRGEFLPSRTKPWLFGALGGAMLTFAALLFGQSLAAEHESVADLYAYFAGTGVLIVLLLLMPPYRTGQWLSSLTRRREEAVDY